MADYADNLNDLSVDDDPKHIRIFDGRIHITADFLCCRFNIPVDFFNAVLDSLEAGSSAFTDGTHCWIDATLFYDLANTPELSPSFPEERQQTILLLLGHFDEHPVVSHA